MLFLKKIKNFEKIYKQILKMIFYKNIKLKYMKKNI